MLHARNENVEQERDENIELETRFGDDTGKDSGNESAETDSDSEEKKEETTKELQNQIMGMNVSKLN